MGIELVHDHLAPFAPPLVMPLRVRMPGGYFGINRYSDTESYILTPDVAGMGSASEGRRIHYTPIRCHTGLDFHADRKDPVFAARSGQVVHINQISDSTNLRVFVRHMDPGPPFFVTRYLHVRDPQIAVGGTVNQGECLALIGGKDGFHLHFEIRQIMNAGGSADWENKNTEPMDPLPFLYRWDKIYHERFVDVIPELGAGTRLQYASVLRQDGIWVFEVRYAGERPIIPLVAPDEGDRNLVALLRDAYMNNKRVRLAIRESPFFEGRKVIMGARVSD